MDFLDRRHALRVLGAAGAGLVLVACGRDNGTKASTTTTGGNPNQRVPSETAGPFPADGTNGPNVLTASGIVRSDITKSFGQYSGTAEGVAMTVRLAVVKASSGSPYAGAAVYAWHCDAEGRYSLYSQGATNQNYLRGVQAADANGVLTFETIVPAAYPGRWPHIHFKVFPSLSEATKAGSRLVTSQIALLEDPCNDVYNADTRYGQSKDNMKQTTLANDGVFRDGAQLETPTMSGSPSTGYILNFKVVV